MQKTLNFPPLASPIADANPSFNVVLAYEDFETGTLARRTYDFLRDHLGEQFHVNHQMWKFEVLAVTKLREMAAQDAATADVIVISARDTGPLPAEVTAWIEQWLQRKSAAIALVALFANPDPFGDGPALKYLGQVARRGKMKFFPQPGSGASEIPPNRLSSTEDADRNGRTLSLLADVVQDSTDVSHWGINE